MPCGVHNSPRGLATASPETRRRVSQAGGFAVALRRGDLFCEARAEKGGQAVTAKYGRYWLTDYRTKRRNQ